MSVLGTVMVLGVRSKWRVKLQAWTEQIGHDRTNRLSYSTEDDTQYRHSTQSRKHLSEINIHLNIEPVDSDKYVLLLVPETDTVSVDCSLHDIKCLDLVINTGFGYGSGFEYACQFGPF